MLNIAFEVAINMAGIGISIFIARLVFVGYRAVSSPNLLRLTFAFISISLGFALLTLATLSQDNLLKQFLTDLGLGSQSLGYFFIAISHSMKSFNFGRTRHYNLFFYPLMMSIIIPGNSIEHLIRSISFILIIYASIETIASYIQNLRKSTFLIGLSLAFLAIGELISWYNFIYPGSLFFYVANSVKIAGFVMMAVPFYRPNLG